MEGFIAEMSLDKLKRRRNLCIASGAAGVLLFAAAIATLPAKGSGGSYLGSILLGVPGVLLIGCAIALLIGYLLGKKNFHRHPFVCLLSEGSVDAAVREVDDEYRKGLSLLYLQASDGKKETIAILPNYFVLVARSLIYVLRAQDIVWAYVTDDTSRGPSRGGAMRGYELTLHHNRKQLSTALGSKDYADRILGVLRDRFGVPTGYDLDLRQLYYNDYEAFLDKRAEMLPPPPAPEDDREETAHGGL